MQYGPTPRENQTSAQPSIISSMLMMAISMFKGSVPWLRGAKQTALLLGFGLLGIIYLIFLSLFIIPHPRFGPSSARRMPPARRWVR